MSFNCIFMLTFTIFLMNNEETCATNSDDILDSIWSHHIFAQLKDEKDLLSLKQVNKRFYKLIKNPQVWLSVAERYKVKISQIRRFSNLLYEHSGKDRIFTSIITLDFKYLPKKYIQNYIHSQLLPSNGPSTEEMEIYDDFAPYQHDIFLKGTYGHITSSLRSFYFLHDYAKLKVDDEDASSIIRNKEK